MENREHFGTLTERMHSFREELLNTEASIDATRAVLASKSFISFSHNFRITILLLHSLNCYSWF